jgi:hypothetical protein
MIGSPLSQSTAWFYSQYPDADWWTGTFNTKEEAISEGISAFGGGEFYVRIGVKQTPSDIVDVDHIIELIRESIMDSASEIAHEASDHVEISEIELGNLHTEIEAWAENSVKVNFSVMKGEPELIPEQPFCVSCSGTIVKAHGEVCHECKEDMVEEVINK